VDAVVGGGDGGWMVQSVGGMKQRRNRRSSMGGPEIRRWVVTENGRGKGRRR